MLVDMSPQVALEHFKKVVKNIFLNARGESKSIAVLFDHQVFIIGILI